MRNAHNRYAYALGNPLKYRDPSGHWVETAWDVANIAWDIHEVKKDPSLLNIGCLFVDVAAAALPRVPAGVGLIARGGKAAKVGVEVVTHVDEIVDGARVLSHADVATRIFKRSVEGFKRFETAGREVSGAIRDSKVVEQFEDCVDLIDEANVVEQIQVKVDVDQFQERVEVLREQLETALHNWREQFTPGVAGPQPVKVEVEAETPKPKKKTAKKTTAKPAAKKTTPKSTAKKTTPKSTAKKPATEE